jgi:hypothetical protein
MNPKNTKYFFDWTNKLDVVSKTDMTAPKYDGNYWSGVLLDGQDNYQPQTATAPNTNDFVGYTNGIGQYYDAVQPPKHEQVDWEKLKEAAEKYGITIGGIAQPEPKPQPLTPEQMLERLAAMGVVLRPAERVVEPEPVVATRRMKIARRGAAAA